MPERHIWLPVIKVGTGSDIYTIRLKQALQDIGYRVTITWFNPFTEFFPNLNSRAAPKSVDIVLANSWNAFAYSNQEIPLISVGHLCVHDPALEPYKSFLQKQYHNHVIKKFESRSISLSDKNLAVSHYAVKQYQAAFPGSNFECIYNWIDTSVFSPEENKQQTKNIKLGFIGTWSYRKGKDLIMKIMQQLPKHYQLYIPSRMSKSRMGLEDFDNITIVNYMNDQIKLRDFYRSLDIFISPTRLEGFGYTLVEAQSCGVPVVAGNNSSLPEVVDNNTSGLLCDTDNFASFVEAITKLGENPELRHAMGSQGRIFVESKFDTTKIIKQYQTLIEELCH